MNSQSTRTVSKMESNITLGILNFKLSFRIIALIGTETFWHYVYFKTLATLRNIIVRKSCISNDLEVFVND